MPNVVVTGANGFLGRALCKELEAQNYRVFEVIRSTEESDLDQYLNDADFVFHFAGEVRPSSDDVAFQSSNADMTKKICERLTFFKRAVPVVFTSSVHAINPNNTYGSSKREAEESLKQYAKLMGAQVSIYRLPHMFGEGCKPNYNSVITTWIYNLIHGLEVLVFDRSVMMTYCYSGDFVDDCISHLNNERDFELYMEPSVTERISLGELVDLLQDINNPEKLVALKQTSFVKKLVSTYQSYL